MKRITTLLFAFCIILNAKGQAGNLSGNLIMSAKLDGASEVPAVTTNALGVASFSMNTTRDTLCIHASFNGLSGAITASHIHEGAPGVSGPVIIDLAAGISGNNLNTMITGAALTQDVISKLLSGSYYINVHTAANPGGEIRGQITLETDFAYTAMMDGAQEVPSVATTAYGLGAFDLYKNDAAISFRVVVQGLSGTITGAHLHIGAPGVSGPVIADLTTLVSGNVIEGEVDPTAFLSDLLAGNIYVNVHTSANPNGEIRGQLVTNTRLAFDARLDGSQETPPVVTSSEGVATVELNTTLDTLWYHVVADGLSGAATGAHFHTGPLGVGGGVVIDATSGIDGNQINGVVTGSTLTPLIDDFLSGNIYFNIHTAANPGGEIRGQVYRYAREGYTFVMDGSQETPPTTSTATGSGLVSIDRFQENAHIMLVCSGLTGPVTGAHLHNNVFGQSGPVIFDMTDWFSMTGTDDAAFGYWTDDDATPFSPAFGAEFIHDSIYANIHTAANPGGEIRGQVTRGADCFTTLVGIADVNDSFSGYNLYPNPASDQLTISFESAISSDAKVEIVDLSGRVASVSKMNIHKGPNQVDVNLASVSDGIYFIRITGKDQSAVLGKFIKQ